LTGDHPLRHENSAMATGPKALPKMMLGFVVRRCAVDVGHQPTAEEFAAWANEQRDGLRTFCLFGRPISVPEARLILRHPGREVTTRDLATAPPVPVSHDATRVTSFADAAVRLRARRK
jgi:hypothetical protein